MKTKPFSINQRFTNFLLVFFKSNLFLLILLSLSKMANSQSYASIHTLAANDGTTFPLTSGCEFEDFDIAYTGSSASSGRLVAIAHGSKTTNTCSGLTVSDDNGHSASFLFNTLTLSYGSITSGTLFYNVDVTLLPGGVNTNKAIVTFETNISPYGSYVIEFDILQTMGGLSISQATLKDPIDNGGTYFVSEPRIDGDWAMNRFAISFIENNEVRYTVYEQTMGAYYTMASLSNITSTQNSPVSPLHPDIALSYDPGSSNEPVVVVSYYDYDVSGPSLALNVDETHGTSTPSNLYSSTLNSLGTYSFALAGYPRIAGENEVSGMGASNMKWSLCVSELGTSASSTIEHLYYMNSALLVPFKLDEQYNTSEDFRNSFPALDWMIPDDDAYVAWTTFHNLGNAADIVSVMKPYSNNVPPLYNEWGQVNYNNSFPIDASSRTAVGSDPVSQEYVVAYSTYYAGDYYIIYKIRNMGSTSFKPQSSSLIANISINIWPSPCKNKLNLFAEDEGNANIYDINGNAILNQNYKKGLNVFNTSNLKDGIYYLISNKIHKSFIVKN